MAACPKCGTENAASARYCAGCGSALFEACRTCGAELPAEARFCPSCGTPVELPPPVYRERKLVTILFADLAGSTELGDSLDPEPLRDVMDAYFASMRGAIEGEGGTVEKFIGDAVMGVFGVPAAHEDDPNRALRAALEMRRRMADPTGPGSALGRDLPIRIGVNTGEVLALTIPHPTEGMVTGDAVNVASRLEHAASDGQILVAERTALASRGFGFRDLGPLDLRGKERPVSVLELLGAEPGDAMRAVGPRPRMVGRERELDLLITLHRRAVEERRSHLVTVFGDPGIGKTRLVDEFAAAVADGTLAASAEIARGRCLPYGDGVTYWALSEILKRRAGVLHTDPPDLALARIREVGKVLLTDDVSSDPLRDIAALCFTVGIEDPGSPMEALEPRQIQAALRGAWRAFFTALAREAPAVVVIEDIHWADPAMLDLLQALADDVDGPVTFVCTSRLDLAKRYSSWGAGRWNFSSVLLEPLSAAEAKTLASALVEAEDFPPDLLARMLEHAGGNPFFLEELVQHIRDERLRSAEHGALHIPDTVQAVLAARIDQLSQTEKRVLQCAAVVGRSFWSGPVERLAHPDGEMADVLTRLEGRGLIRGRLSSSIAGEREWVFKHVLIRDVAYESLPYRDRSDAHAVVAAWIEERAGDRQREFVELLSHHYVQAYRGLREAGRRGGEHAEALRRSAYEHTLAASDEARRRLVVDRAVRFGESALDLAASPQERSTVLESLGEAHLLEPNGAAALRSFRGALDALLDADVDAPRRIARLCARALELPVRWPGIMTSRPSREELAPLLERGLADAGEGDTEELARLLTVRSLWPYAFGDEAPEAEAAAGLEAGEAAAAMALRLGRPDLASAALDGVASYHTARGRYGEVVAVVGRRLALAGDLDDPSELGDIFASAAWAHLYQGRYREALDLADEGFAKASEVPVLALFCLDWRALARFALGDWDGFLADDALADDLLGDRRDDPPGFAAQRIGVRAYLHEVRGDRAAADAALERLAHLEASEEQIYVPRVAWLARVLTRRGEFDEAVRQLERVEAPAFDWARGPVLEAWCDLAGAAGWWDRADEIVERARDHAHDAGLIALPFHADLLEGRRLLAADDAVAAAGTLARGRAGFIGLGSRFEAARAAVLIAQVIRPDRSEERARLLADALATFESIGAAREITEARELTAAGG